MRPIKTFIIGLCLLVNFAAPAFAMATILNGGTLGQAAIISKSDALTSVFLLAAALVTNLFLAIALFRRRGLRRAFLAATSPADRLQDPLLARFCPNCGAGVDEGAWFCQGCN